VTGFNSKTMEFEKDVKNPPDSAEESARDLAGTTNMTTSMTDPRPRSMTGSSSDNESWTILDEDDPENDRLVTLNTRIDVIKATAQFTKREFDQNAGPGHHFESDSDIETIDEKNAESNCESLAQNNSGRFLKFLKIIEFPWLIRGNDCPCCYITELKAIGDSYGHW